MPLTRDKKYIDRAAFIAAHPLAHAPGVAAVLVGPGNFEVGEDFFTVSKTPLADLQAYIDTTHTMRKKLTFMGGNAQNAKAMVARAITDSGTDVRVRWGLHQSEDRPVGVTGLCTHFTIIDPTGGNDWHCYVNTDGSRLSFMSDGPGNFTTISKP